MDIPTPIQLNFVKQLNVFQEIKFLDQQYGVQLKRFNKRVKFDPSDTKDKNHPLWELEKKILLWTFLAHKHLDSVLLLDRMGESDFRKDAYISVYEYKMAKPKRPFGNLVQRGYAEWEETKDGGGIKITSNGRMAGVIIAYTQFVEKEINPADESGIRKFKWRKFGWVSYQLLLIGTYLLLFLSASLLAITFLEAARLVDDVINFLAINAYLLASVKVILLLFAFVALISFITGIVLVFVNQIKVTKELANRTSEKSI